METYRILTTKFSQEIKEKIESLKTSLVSGSQKERYELLCGQIAGYADALSVYEEIWETYKKSMKDEFYDND
jgi:phosphoheptose isomerase